MDLKIKKEIMMKKGLFIVLLLAVIASPVFSKTIEKVDEYTITISTTVEKSESKTLTALKNEKERLENELAITQIRNDEIETTLTQMIADVDSSISDAEGLGIVEEVSEDIIEVVEKDAIFEESTISEEVITK